MIHATFGPAECFGPSVRTWDDWRSSEDEARHASHDVHGTVRGKWTFVLTDCSRNRFWFCWFNNEHFCFLWLEFVIMLFLYWKDNKENEEGSLCVNIWFSQDSHPHRGRGMKSLPLETRDVKPAVLTPPSGWCETVWTQFISPLMSHTAPTWAYLNLTAVFYL